MNYKTFVLTASLVFGTLSAQAGDCQSAAEKTVFSTMLTQRVVYDATENLAGQINLDQHPYQAETELVKSGMIKGEQREIYSIQVNNSSGRSLAGYDVEMAVSYASSDRRALCRIMKVQFIE